MEEIKVGDYVRFSDGKIFKVPDESEANYYNYIIRDEISVINKPKIVKYSSNIIDLIEESDYVNGKYVYSVGTAIGNLPIINYTDGTFTPSNMIKSIVTKEQFSSIEYKL